MFGTGGLGGVHRGGEDSMDISADLTELGRTPIAVVSSGCKSFLDIPRTLEFLETQGATVCTFADGRKGDIDFPAFYTRDSGIKSHGIVQNPREAASMICEFWNLNLIGRRKADEVRCTRNPRQFPQRPFWHAFGSALREPNPGRVLDS